ncbi:MAG: GTP 3',8-cyclase MoaA [Eudoraea sp.]|nr:GTP 3',8-cyclase MoaA [Eudoraea sp.]
MQLKDSFDRTIDYVRIAVTDRCNLRCFYCMPMEGITYEPKAHLLTYEEITRLLSVLGKLGFKKVRFTGGEPFLRKDFVKLLESTNELQMYDSIHITSNGTLLEKHIPKLKELGIKNINLSIDSLDEVRFKKITRRNDFTKVIRALNSLLDEGFNLKINAVVMFGVNTQDILPLAEFAKSHPVNIRFIEEMPFNGGYKKNAQIFKANDIYRIIKNEYPSLSARPKSHGETATNYQINEFKGDIGIIPAFSRTFCNTCNRLRITAKGEIKTCLYDGGVFSIRDFMRRGISDEELTTKFVELIKLKPKNGFEAEKSGKNTLGREVSMSSIGG